MDGVPGARVSAGWNRLKGEVRMAAPSATIVPEAACLSVDGLVELLELQRGLYMQLKTLGGEQDQQISGGSSEGLLTVLGQRRQVIDRLAVVNADFEPYRRGWSRYWLQMSELQRQHVGELLKQVQQTLGEIIERDNLARRQLEEGKSRLAAGMGRISHTSRAMRAYKVPPAVGNRFTDSRG